MIRSTTWRCSMPQARRIGLRRPARSGWGVADLLRDPPSPSSMAEFAGGLAVHDSSSRSCGCWSERILPELTSAIEQTLEYSVPPMPDAVRFLILEQPTRKAGRDLLA